VDAGQTVAKLNGKRRERKVGKKPSPKGIKGVSMAEKTEGETMFESFSKIGEKFFSMDGVKKVAAWYIETGEKLAIQALELQEKATAWAKDTPLAPIFEAQVAITRKLVEGSYSTARSLWQIQPE
jgi:hypothetical protein